MMTDEQFDELIAGIRHDTARLRAWLALLTAFMAGFILAGLAFNGAL